MRKKASWRLPGLAIVALCISACATAPKDASSEKEVSGVDTAVDQTRDGFGDAALTPLNDLNLRRQEIPAILKQLKSPYTPVPNASCGELSALIGELDAVLGPDVDIPGPEDDDPTLNQRAGDAASDATLDAVSSTTGGFIPFRGLVRQASGATAYEKRVRAAYQRGLQRRAYLKGLGEASGCPPPAAPYPFVETGNPKIEYKKVNPNRSAPTNARSARDANPQISPPESPTAFSP